MKKYLLLLFLSLNLYSSEYCVELDGDKVATLNSFNSLSSGFIQTELDWKASLYSGYDSLIVYDSRKTPPKKENTKYIKDNAGIISLLNFFHNKENPKNKIEIDNEKNFLSINCENSICRFSAQDKINLKIYSGYIKKKGNKIIDFYEKRNKLRIRLVS